MQVSLDTIIFTLFMLANLVVGLFYGRGVKNVREYAIGDRRFATSTLTTTVIATYIGGGFITGNLTESYRQGLYFIIPALGDPLALVVIGYFLIPRMTGFFGKQSVAEAMGDLYGDTVKVITALVGSLRAIGVLALQFKVGGLIMQIFFDVSSVYAVILSSVVIVIYSAFGGIRAVVYTDVLQFVVFCIIIPIICLFVWQESEPSLALQTIATSPLFDFTEVMSPSNPRFFALVCLFLIFVIPSVDPTFFQRISMSKGVKQAQKAFILSGMISLLLFLVVSSTSVIIFASNPDLNPVDLLPHIIKNYTSPVFKILASAGIMAAVMSTADSYLNSASVLFAHDVLGVFGINKCSPQKQLLYTRITSLAMGIGAFVIAYKAQGLFQILIMTMSIYMPVISPPLLLAIFGFRSNAKAVLTGMMAGISVVLFWSDFYQQAHLDGFSNEILEETNEMIPGMLANVIAFAIAHFIFGKPKPKEKENGEERGKEKEEAKGSLSHKAAAPDDLQNKSGKLFCKGFFSSIKNISLMDFYKANFYQDDKLYAFAGTLSAMLTFSVSYLISVVPNTTGFFLIYCTSLICSCGLIVCPIWLPLFSQRILILYRIITIPFVLVFVPLIFAVMDQPTSYQTMILLLNILVFVCAVKWQMAVAVIAVASYAAMTGVGIKFYGSNILFGHDFIYYKLQLQIISMTLFITGILITFFKSKQSKDMILEEKIDYLEYISEGQNNEIVKLSDIKSEFLRNLQHETNTPLTGVYSMSQALNDCYDKLDDKQRKDTIAVIMRSSERLISYVHNLVDVSKLMTHKFKSDVRNVNLSRLTEEAVRRCKRLYIPNEAEDDRDFIINIEPNIIGKCDEYLIKRSFENVIINAIQYCKKGTITITLAKIQNTESNTDSNQSQAEGQNWSSKIIFSVRDAGIGIPQEDLSNIFEPFMTSTRTRTPAGGRGVGLSLVKKAIELHKGTVVAESNEHGGSMFTLNVPV